MTQLYWVRTEADELARNAKSSEVKKLAGMVVHLCERIEALEAWKATVKVAKIPPPEDAPSDG